MNRKGIAALAGLGILLALPFVTPAYFLHLLIQILLWGFIYTAWSIMGRFGLVSLGHGAFMGIGAYVPALLWNYFDVTPWLGIPIGIILSGTSSHGTLGLKAIKENGQEVFRHLDGVILAISEMA